MWHPAVTVKGKMTAQSHPGIRQPEGTISVDKIAIAMKIPMQMIKASQKRLRILGTSSQKFERSTSFLVAPHVMLYENI